MDLKPDDLRPAAQPKRLPCDERADIMVRSETKLAGTSPRSLAFSMYVKDHKRPVEIAIELGLPLSQVARWFASGRWVAKRRELDQSVIEADQHAYRVLQALEKLAVAREQLAMGKVLEAGVMESIETTDFSHVSSKDLKNLADAALAATTLRSRVVGISDKIAQSDSETRPQSLLIIGAPPPVPAGPVSVEAIETIDTEASEGQ